MTTQDGRQYQVVVLISVPSIFVILLEGGILADPNEVREGLVGDWRQSPHTRRWKSHGYYGGGVVPAGRFSSGHISSPNAPCPRVFSFLVTGDKYNCYCPRTLNRVPLTQAMKETILQIPEPWSLRISGKFLTSFPSAVLNPLSWYIGP